jgi:hypothetical protein
MEKKEQWKDEIIQSLNGMQQAKPPADLFSKIQANINKTNADIIPLAKIKWIAVAASILLLANVIGIKQYQTKQQSVELNQSTAESSFISNYNLYN